MHIASCSFGKDSLCMVLMLLERNAPLDEVIFYDTGAEFQAIYNIKEKIEPILKDRNIPLVTLTPKEPFFYTMLEKPCYSPQKGHHNGYGWCGGVCRWGTTGKLQALDKYAEEKDAVVYIGIAADEASRLYKERKPYKRFPLADWGITEKKCLEYCYSRGYNWIERTKEGDIDLYAVLSRVSCWCCCNKNKKELYNIYKYLPEYWDKLLELQSKLDRPMKKFHNKQYGDYGNLFKLNEVFKRGG